MGDAPPVRPLTEEDLAGSKRPLVYITGARCYPWHTEIYSINMFVIICALVATAAATPDHYGPPPTRFYGIPRAYSGPVIPILKDEHEGPGASGVYSFEFETGNGIKREEQGAPQGPSGAVAMQGGWSFTFPDGSPAVMSFVADDAGYRVESDLLPTPHPLPAHAIAQIEKARREDAAAAALSGRYSTPRTSYGYP
ncbi:endocuticle structural glycoprotein SgAbd-2-like [Penaeus chinensis]|uniref:endocuticle structural glycoprotein SgAbd-2-like n=1 Tax=Penaeus chinensis TaxID=139456 RepID=UPI001FB7E677|nr:endocuticle structural glycoprotein SgAbd-2-like [Penaeus chinensis]